MRSVLAQKKRGQLNNLTSGIITLVVSAVFLILGLVMLQEFRDTDVVGGTSELVNDTAYIQTNITLSGLGTFADFWEIIVLAIVISVVIGLLLTVFGQEGKR